MNDGARAADRAAAKRERRATARAERARRLRRERRSARVRRALVWAAGLLAIVLVGLSLVRGGSGGVAFSGDLRVGGALRSLQLPALEGHGTVTYATYADRPLVINFFASWCPNCVAEMPDFERVHQRLGDRVAFLGISQSDARGASIDLAHRTGITYDTAFDERGAFFSALGSTGMPTTVFVRPGGEIADIWVGALNAETLEALIAEHFGQTG
jgi:thiol-disulfide isomerase/thioredoxin